jgi:hypothetical protein
MFVCEYCNKEYNSKGWLANHKGICPKKEIYDEVSKRDKEIKRLKRLLVIQHYSFIDLLNLEEQGNQYILSILINGTLEEIKALKEGILSSTDNIILIQRINEEVVCSTDCLKRLFFSVVMADVPKIIKTIKRTPYINSPKYRDILYRLNEGERDPLSLMMWLSNN